MHDLNIVIVGTFAIRLLNAILWTVVCYQILRHDRPVPRLVRQLLVTVIIFGMWVFVIGGVTPFGFPAEAARNIYTIFTAYAGLIAVGILTTPARDK